MIYLRYINKTAGNASLHVKSIVENDDNGSVLTVVLSKLTRKEKKDLKQLVMDCSIKRLTNEESFKNISTRLGKAISIRHIERIRKQTRQETREWIINLANQGDYIVEYKNRIAEIEKMQQEMWATYRLGQTNPVTIRRIGNKSSSSVSGLSH